jgi:hypothetical protein
LTLSQRATSCRTVVVHPGHRRRLDVDLVRNPPGPSAPAHSHPLSSTLRPGDIPAASGHTICDQLITPVAACGSSGSSAGSCRPGRGRRPAARRRTRA